MWIEISKKEFDEKYNKKYKSILNPNNDSCFKERIYEFSNWRTLKETSHLIEGEWRTSYYKNTKFFND